MLRRKTPLRSKQGLKRSTKPINKVGRVGRYRRSRKQQWIADFPPDDKGWYKHCVLCGRPVHVSNMHLEHEYNKGSTPKAIADADEHLGPSHPICNEEKGSKNIPWKYPSPSSLFDTIQPA